MFRPGRQAQEVAVFEEVQLESVQIGWKEQRPCVTFRVCWGFLPFSQHRKVVMTVRSSSFFTNASMRLASGRHETRVQRSNAPPKWARTVIFMPRGGNCGSLYTGDNWGWDGY